MNHDYERPILPASHHRSKFFDQELEGQEPASEHEDFNDLLSFPAASRIIFCIWVAAIAFCGWVMYVAYHAIQGAS